MPKIDKKPSKNASRIPYPEVDVRICKGDEAITADVAKELLDWREETKENKFNDDFLFVDEYGRKVRCWNNTKNRPLNEQWAKTLGQDILNRKWRFNLETIIISKFGQVLSGQHRLVGIVLAKQMWEKAKPDHQWKQLWETEPVLESLLALGGEETDEVTQTLDNVRPRTLADTLYTSSLFKAWKPRDKKAVVRVADYATRLLWDRTGMSQSKYAGKMTNSEAYEFLNRHLKVIDCVKHIYEEDMTGKGSIRQCIGLGYAAGLMYLQAANDDDRLKYETTSPPEQSALKLGRWDDACRFWIDFAVSRKFGEVRGLLQRVDKDGVRAPLPARLGVVIKAWKTFLAKEPLTEENVDLAYDVDATGQEFLAEYPKLDGIDVGNDPEEAEEEE